MRIVAMGSSLRGPSGTAPARLASLALVGLAAACATQPPTAATGRRVVRELAPGVPVGYLPAEQRPDSLRLLPLPPSAGSAALAFDEETRRHAVALRGTPRWTLAGRDASLETETALETFECALGTAIDIERTPRLFQLLQRVIVDAGYSTDGAKVHYQRTRPFVRHREPMCTPDEDAELREDGSYPSGHAALGWAVGLALAEVAPDRANEVLKRGLSFGDSRVVCNVHWQSDVIAGRTMGAATMARLQSVPEFEEDVAIARSEVANARATALMPSRDCAVEASALEQALKGAW